MHEMITKVGSLPEPETEVGLDQTDVDLNFTRRIRRGIAESIIKDGIPTDNRDRRILLETLDGMDNAALQRKKIDSDNNANNNALIAVNTIAEIFTKHNMKDLTDNTIDGVMKELDSSIPDAVVVPGELEENSIVTYEEFMLKNDPNYIP